MGLVSNLSFDDQISLLKSRGITFEEQKHNKDVHSLQVIGYYKLKEFAEVFARGQNEHGDTLYREIEFSEVIKRYYQDKNLRVRIFHAIESIEVALNTSISYRLGTKYGAFGYLRFRDWADHSISGFDLEKKQYDFKRYLLSSLKRSSSLDLKNPINRNSDGFPTVWLMTDLLTFGESAAIFKLMSRNNQIAVASSLGCTAKELISWLPMLNLVRNICSHNSDLLDIRLVTVPYLPREYMDCLYRNGKRYTDRIAIIVYIIKSLMKMINPTYQFHDIWASLTNVVGGDDKAATELGFTNADIIEKISPKPVHRRNSNKYPKSV